jgi:hypothetical protein
LVDSGEMLNCGYCGALVDRLVLGRRCAACCRQRQQEWRDKNRERLRSEAAARRAARRADPVLSEQDREYTAAWYAKHPEYGRGGGHVSGADHPRYEHGLSGTPEHAAWGSARDRCTNPHSSSWANYGGRGIGMCPEWAASFEAFLAHIGPRPSPSHSLDRYPDNDGHYEPGNVRWATKREQDRNRRTTKLTLEQTEAILVRREHGESPTAIAVDYGISPSYVTILMRRHGRAASSK